MSTIRVADSVRAPGGRYEKDGPHSGEWYRETVLRPALEQAIGSGEELVVELDGTSGYGSSFLEEAFGGLVRTAGRRRDEVGKKLRVVAKTELYRPYQLLAEKYIANALTKQAA